MATLKAKAQSILDEKNTKIIPTNIKVGVQIFDVEGTYEGAGEPAVINLDYESQEFIIYGSVLADILDTGMPNEYKTLRVSNSTASGFSTPCIKVCNTLDLLNPASTLFTGFIGIAVNIEDSKTALIYHDVDGNGSVICVIDSLASRPEYSINMTFSDLISILNSVGTVTAPMDENIDLSLYNDFSYIIYKGISSLQGYVVDKIPVNQTYIEIRNM